MKKRGLIYFIVIIIAVALYWFLLRPTPNSQESPKQAAIVIKKHSQVFNNNIDKLMSDYIALKDAFVEADTTLVKAKCLLFIQSLESIDTIELKKDTSLIYETIKATIADVQANASSLLVQTDITEMRKDFSGLTDMMYPTFFQVINYEGPTMYLQNCPMAFDDEIPANWISNSNEVVNPYLGKKHPKYKAAMVNCGEVKDSIN